MIKFVLIHNILSKFIINYNRRVIYDVLNECLVEQYV